MHAQESVHKKKETLEESLWERMNYIQAIHDMNEKQEKNDSDLLNKVLDNNSMMQNELVKQG